MRGSAPDDPSTQFAVPTSEAGDDLAPIAEQPRDTRAVDGDGYLLYAPSEFQQSERPGPDGVPIVVLGKSSNRSGGVVEVISFVEKEPPSGVQEQMLGLEGSKQLQGGTEITRESVQWPGAEQTVVVRWLETRATAQGEVEMRFAQLSAQRETGAIVTVIAVAPKEEFDDSGAMDILRTLSFEGAA